jgi:hypothetical protein
VIILQFFSGVFFVFTDLPGWMQQVAALFPLKWMTQGMRSVFLPDSFAAQEVAGQRATPRRMAVRPAARSGGANRSSEADGRKRRGTTPAWSIAQGNARLTAGESADETGGRIPWATRNP